MASFLDVLGIIATPLTGLISGFTGAMAQESANETNLQLARENRDWQEKMWNLNNQYNTPANQIARLKAAGLNPNLMYGQGTVGNSSSPASGVATPRVNPVNYLQGLVGLPDAMLKVEQAKLLDAQRKKVESTTIPNADYLAGFQARTKLSQASINQIEHNVKYIDQLRDLTEQQVNYYGADRSAAYEMMRNQIDQGWERISNDAARIAIAEYQAQTGRMVGSAQASQMYQMAGLLRQKVTEAIRNNEIGEATKSGQILQGLAKGLLTWSLSEQGKFNANWQGAQRIFDNLMKIWHEGNSTVDAVVPF